MGWSQNNKIPLSWTHSNVVYNTFLTQNNASKNTVFIPVIKRILTKSSPYIDVNKHFDFIRYNFSDKPTLFNKEKNYQFNTIVTNYYQQRDNDGYFSPPLYMITPLGLEKDVISDKLYENYLGMTGSSDTAYYPHPYFIKKDDERLNSNGYGRIFCLHYYSNPLENVISYKQNNAIHYLSNSLFGNTLGTKYNSDEGIVSFNINEINWLIQGYSSTSLYRIDTNNEQIFTEKYWIDQNNLLTGGTLFGKGWYSYPNNTYIWMDGFFNYDVDYQNRWHKKNQSMFGSDDTYDMRNQPVGGPWTGSPDVNIPSNGDYENTTTNYKNNGSILNGTVKTPHEGFRENNYLAKYVNMDRYNLSITYKNERADNTGVRIYTSNILPSRNPIQYTSKIFNTKSTIDKDSVGDIILDNAIELRIKLNIKCDFIGGLILNLKSQNGKIINIFNGVGGELNSIKTTFTFNLDKKQISTILENDWNSIGNSLFSIKGDMDSGILTTNKSNTRNFKDFNNGTFTLLLEHTLGYEPQSVDCSLIIIYDEFLSNTPIAHLTQSNVESTYNFYGLDGNQYIVLVADKISSPVNGNTATHSIVTLKNLNISNSYHHLNNNQISISDDSFYPIGLSGSTYSYKATIGSGNNIDGTQSTIELNTMIGTGRFTSGIWENGNWINGWRDSEIYEFFNINNFYSYNRDKKWIFSLYGPNESVSKLNIGDKISISNIIAVDINERRTLLKNYFTIIDKSYSTIVVEFTWEFPLRRIERDSNNHFINVSKNIWLNGYFFNGRFSGIWNDGVVLSYPFLTRMEKTHWIDGEFNGGHFRSRPILKTVNSNNLFESSSNKLQIKFDYPHKLNVGDQIYINENDDKASNIFGKTLITNLIDSNNILVDINYSNSFKNIINKILYITVYKTDGLIQNMNFNSLNVSKSISSESMDSRTIFSFNSWMDLVYDSSYATNILKPQSNYDDNLSRYSENNLYGWITKDVLSSNSTFRDSFSNTIRTYKLGYKYEEVYDYIGNTSYFNEYFLPNSPQFDDLGWKRTTFTQSSLIFSRTVDDGNDKLILGKELKVEAYKEGGVLNITDPKITIKNRELSKINDGRYTMVSFDLINHKTTYDYYAKGVSTNPTYKQPLIHFSNLNIVNKKGMLLKATYLPVNKNVDHVTNENKTKIEYFYNKKDLMMNFRGSGKDGLSTSTYIIDNLKFYETDMIPFFQYYNYSNINRSIQIPIHIKKYQSIKEDYNYDLIDYTYYNNLNSLVYSDNDKQNYINSPRYKDLYEIPNYNNFKNGYDWNNTNFGNDTD